MLVRHVLSQLSYAPLPESQDIYISATGIIILKEHLFVKHFFSFLLKKFKAEKTHHIIEKSHAIQTLFKSPRMSSGVNL